jgi:hypothetical protein
VQVARRLVGEDDFRARHHRSRDRNELLLPARQLAGIQVLLSHDPEPVEGVGDERLALRALDVPVRERDVEVFGDGEAVQQVVLLEDETDVLLVDLRPLLH